MLSVRSIGGYVMTERIYTAANYLQTDDDFTQMFLEQNQAQFWLPSEISLTPDVLQWKDATPAERTAYMRALAGLTTLDTWQGDSGMAEIMRHVEGHQRKALLSYMGSMENSVHAKSYSNIFLTLATAEEVQEVFAWGERNPYLQYKAGRIVELYENIVPGDRISLYKALVASTMLESFLFYSGFYYPLYMYGHGRLMQSGEIINLIIRDEAVHSVYIGLLAQEIYNAQDSETQAELYKWVTDLLGDLYENEKLYTMDVYGEVGLAEDVLTFVQYNANKTMQNLGFDGVYDHKPVNAMVLNGLSTQTKSHDFFSMKGNGYRKSKVEPIRDEDFKFDDAA